MPFTGVGAPMPDQQELDPVLVRRSVIYADSRESAVNESGDVIIAKVNKSWALEFDSLDFSNFTSSRSEWLKPLDTFGNYCQRPVFFGVSQHMHKPVTVGLNWSS